MKREKFIVTGIIALTVVLIALTILAGYASLVFAVLFVFFIIGVFIIMDMPLLFLVIWHKKYFKEERFNLILKERNKAFNYVFVAFLIPVLSAIFLSPFFESLEPFLALVSFVVIFLISALIGVLFFDPPFLILLCYAFFLVALSIIIFRKKIIIFLRNKKRA